MTRFLGSIAVLCLGSAVGVGARQLAAQENCGTYTFCFGGEEHKVPQGTGWGWNNPHSNCMACIEPEGCHLPCQFGFSTPKARAAYGGALAAAARGDVGSVVNLAMFVPERVLLNPVRGSIQILSCDGTSVVANLDLPGIATRTFADRTTGSLESIPSVFLPIW